MAHITFEARDPETGYPHKLPAGSLSLSSQHNSRPSSDAFFIPRRPPLKSADIKRGLSDIGALSLAVLFLCSVAIGFPVAIAMLLFGSF